MTTRSFAFPSSTEFAAVENSIRNKKSRKLLHPATMSELATNKTQRQWKQANKKWSTDIYILSDAKAMTRSNTENDAQSAVNEMLAF